jgi:uncharacterized protein (DUF1330 family)
MIVSNAVRPTPENIQAFIQSDFYGPVCMLNLLRFKDTAAYADGRQTDLSGAAAYQLYGDQMLPFVASRGGRFIFAGSADHLIIGELEDKWDSVAIVEYPSKEAFAPIVMAPEVREFGVHRAAGLDGQLLIAMSQMGTLTGS